MTHRYLISQDSPVLYITVVTKDRLPVFRTEQMKEVLSRSIAEARKHFLLFAYVIMLDHLHLLTSRPSSTSEVLRALKGVTARRVIDYLKEKDFSRSLAKLEHGERDRNHLYSLWQAEKNVLPIRAGIVERAIEYRWSSARIWGGCPLENEPLLVDKDLIHWRQRP